MICAGDRYTWNGFSGEWRIIEVGDDSVRLSKSRTQGAVLYERTVHLDELAAQWTKR